MSASLCEVRDGTSESQFICMRTLFLCNRGFWGSQVIVLVYFHSKALISANASVRFLTDLKSLYSFFFSFLCDSCVIRTCVLLILSYLISVVGDNVLGTPRNHACKGTNYWSHPVKNMAGVDVQLDG